jgi:hypothetical protein
MHSALASRVRRARQPTASRAGCSHRGGAGPSFRVVIRLQLRRRRRNIPIPHPVPQSYGETAARGSPGGQAAQAPSRARARSTTNLNEIEQQGEHPASTSNRSAVAAVATSTYAFAERVQGAGRGVPEPVPEIVFRRQRPCPTHCSRWPGSSGPVRGVLRRHLRSLCGARRPSGIAASPASGALSATHVPACQGVPRSIPPPDPGLTKAPNDESTN